MIFRAFKVLADYLRTFVLFLWRQSRGHEALVTLNEIKRVRKVIGAVFAGDNPLLPLSFIFSSRGYHGRIEMLRGIIGSDTILGTWAIDQKGIDKLWELLEKKQATNIIEFGSGVSTLAIAAWLKSSGNESGFCLSIEQDREEAQRNTDRLKAAGLENYATVIQANLTEDSVYSLDFNQIDDLRKGRLFDFAFVDAPAGKTGCREHTLPIVDRVLAPSGTWVLHDALRDGEIEIVEKWSAKTCFSFDGFNLAGQGMAVGAWLLEDRS